MLEEGHSDHLAQVVPVTSASHLSRFPRVKLLPRSRRPDKNVGSKGWEVSTFDVRHDLIITIPVEIYLAGSPEFRRGNFKGDL